MFINFFISFLFTRLPAGWKAEPKPPQPCRLGRVVSVATQGGNNQRVALSVSRTRCCQQLFILFTTAITSAVVSQLFHHSSSYSCTVEAVHQPSHVHAFTIPRTCDSPRTIVRSRRSLILRQQLLRGYSDRHPPVEVRTSKEGGRQCRAEKRSGNGPRSVKVEDNP
jgi:hypothetical protein